MKKGLSKLLFVLAASIVSLSSCTEDSGDTVSYQGTNYYSSTTTLYYFGTSIVVTLYDESEDALEGYLEDIEEIFIYYDKLNNIYESEIDTDLRNVYYINENRGTFVTVEEELFDLLVLAKEMEEITNGYFTPLLGNLTEMFRELKEAYTAWEEGDEEITFDYEKAEEEYQKFLNSSWEVDKENKTVKIEGEATLDLSAIAKGYAVEMVYQYILNETDLEFYMVNAGSSSILVGKNPRRETGKYNIAISSVNSNPSYVFSVSDSGVATSAISQQNITLANGDFFTHIVNPFVSPINGGYDPVHKSITLLGENSGVLDAMATAMLNMDIEDIASLAEELNLKVILSTDGETFSYKSDYFE